MREKYPLLLRIDKDKAVKIVVAVGILALLGIVCSESLPALQKQGKQTETAQVSLEQYRADLEQRLQTILSRVDGIGECAVMITLDSGTESIYSSDRESAEQSEESTHSSDEKTKHVIIDNSGESPVLEKEIEPTLRGVIVVCEGADNVAVREAVVDAVRAGLGLSESHISVIKGGNYGK